MISTSNLKYLIPNSFTAFSMVLGVISAYLSVRGELELAAWMITWGVLLDKLDGSAARLFNASSGFGVQFDSFADFIIFGLAPASLYFHWLGGLDGRYGLVAAIIACMYVVMTATRLAIFNVSEPEGGERYFFGLPTTLSGATLSTLYLTWQVYWPTESKMGALPESLQFAALCLLVLFSVLMVSRFLLPKLKPRRSLIVNIFQFSNVGAAYVLAPLMLFPQYLLTLCLIYIAVGFSSGLIHGIVLETPQTDT